MCYFKSIIRDVQDEWLGHFALLVAPHGTFTDEGQKAFEKVVAHNDISEGSAEVILGL